MTMFGRAPRHAGVRAQAIRGLAVAVLIGAAAPFFAQITDAISSTAPPALVQAQGLSGTTIELLWTAVPGATGYKVYRDGSGTALASISGTRYDDTSVVPLSAHSYTVTAIGDTESIPSTAATATAQAAADASPPTMPGVITASSLTSTSVKLSWARSTDDVGIEGYRILRGPAGATGSQLVDIDTTDGVNAYSATHLRANTSYTFGVLALDSAGNVSGTRTVAVNTKTSADTTIPTATTNITTRVFSSSRIDLWWSASGSSDVASYQILRNGTMIGQIDLPARMTFSDNGLAASTTYSYTIRTVDSAGHVSSSSSSRSAKTLASGQVIVARGPYVQWVTGSSARVVWWTNLPTPGVVSCAGCPQPTYVDPTSTMEHVMLLSGLAAGTTYAYTAGNGTVSAAGSFSTAVPAGTSFSFAAIGDYGGGSPGETGNGQRMAVDGTSFIQTLGDNIYPESADPNFATTYSDYDARLFRPFGTAMAAKAFWGANGNKEYYGNGAWFTHMWLPNNERWYSYDWGDAHILVLDTEQPFAPGTPQYQFAQADLAAHQASAWRIVALQRPAYSSTSANSSSVPVRASLVPLFEAQNVQLVLSGNSHNYERTNRLLSKGDPSNPVVDPNGITYLVSGNGGNGFNAFTSSQPYWSASRQATTYGYELVTVNPSSIVLKAMSSAGALLDTATITGPTPTPGAIGGTVTDVNTASPIAGATVTSSGGSATTAGDGTYSIPNVAPGTYSVTASFAGYTSRTNSGVVVTSGTTTTSDFALTPAPTVRIFSDGFETGNLSNWTTTGGLTVEGSVVHAGSFAAEGNTTTGATYAKKLLPSTYASGYLRAYIRINGAASQVNVLRFRTAADGSIGYLFVTASGALGLRNDVGAQTITSTNNFSFGAWHGLEVHFTIGASGSTEVWLDGSPLASLGVTANLGTTNIGKVQIGEVSSARTYDVVFDDVVFDTSPIGP